MAKIKVLVIEDDRSLSEALSYNLKQAGYDVLTAFDGQDGLLQAQVKLPDIVILDLMLPVIDGLDVCRRLRDGASTRTMVIVMLTAKAEETDELIGFALGADDYVTKPYSTKVLLKRLEVLKRRADREALETESTTLAGVTVDRRKHRASVDGKDLKLTRSEFRLLDMLIRNAGRVFDRTELIDGALGEDTMVMERTIDVHIRALRRKLEETKEGAQNVVETVRGVGYRFQDAPEAVPAE